MQSCKEKVVNCFRLSSSLPPSWSFSGMRPDVVTIGTHIQFKYVYLSKIRKNAGHWSLQHWLVLIGYKGIACSGPSPQKVKTKQSELLQSVWIMTFDGSVDSWSGFGTSWCFLHEIHLHDVQQTPGPPVWGPVGAAATDATLCAGVCRLVPYIFLHYSWLREQK